MEKLFKVSYFVKGVDNEILDYTTGYYYESIEEAKRLINKVIDSERSFTIQTYCGTITLNKKSIYQFVVWPAD